MKEDNKILCKDMKKGQICYLTYDFYGLGGTEVKFKFFATQKELKDMAFGEMPRGEYAIFVDSKGNHYTVPKSAWMFKDKPQIQGIT